MIFSPKAQLLSEYLMVTIGILLASVGLKSFLIPNGFLDGGLTGVALLVNELFRYNVSLVLLILSIPFLWVAWKTMSPRIFLKSLFGIIGLAIFLEVNAFTAATDDKLLIAVFGGFFLGSGIGLAIKNGAVLDGSEILGVYMSQRWGLQIGHIILAFNVVLFGVTALVLSVEIALYGILTYLVTAKCIDLVIEGFEDYVGLVIVSPEFLTIEERISVEIGAGLTVYKGLRGKGTSGLTTDVEIIQIFINRIDIRRTYNLINQIDPEAFIAELDVNHIQGGLKRRMSLLV